VIIYIYIYIYIYTYEVEHNMDLTRVAREGEKKVPAISVRVGVCGGLGEGGAAV